MAFIVDLVLMVVDVGRDLGFDGRRQHSLSTIAENFLERILRRTWTWESGSRSLHVVAYLPLRGRLG